MGLVPAPCPPPPAWTRPLLTKITPEPPPAAPCERDSPLTVDIAGGGPVGLLFAHLLCHCLGNQVELRFLLALLTLPIEKLVCRHDLAWSRALEKRLAS